MLTVLIPYLQPRDQAAYNSLIVQLSYFADGLPVEFLSLPNKGELKRGALRQQMIEQVKTPYLVFIDADDKVNRDYFTLIMQGLYTDVDCVGLRGIITTNGLHPFEFEHSTRHDKWFERIEKGRKKYFRPINHLNPIRTEIAKQIGYNPTLHHGEDLDYSMRLAQSGLLKSEHFIEQPIYYYLYKSRK